MNTISETIRQYKHGFGVMERRLEELRMLIDEHQSKGSVPVGLYERRMFLQTELMEMTGAIREMEEYLHTAGKTTTASGGKIRVHIGQSNPAGIAASSQNRR